MTPAEEDGEPTKGDRETGRQGDRSDSRDSPISPVADAAQSPSSVGPPAQAEPSTTIRGSAERMRLHLKQSKESLEMQNDAAEIGLRAERRAGEMLKEGKEKGERAKPGQHVGNQRTLEKSHVATIPPTLKEIGVSKTESSRWQQLASISEEGIVEPSGQSAPDFGVSEDEGNEADNLVRFPAAESASTRGRKKRDVFGPDSIYADTPVRSSKGKYTFRIRWQEADGSRPFLTSRSMSVSDFKKLERSEKKLEAYKKQLVELCRSRALRAGHGADRRADGVS